MNTPAPHSSLGHSRRRRVILPFSSTWKQKIKIYNTIKTEDLHTESYSKYLATVCHTFYQMYCSGCIHDRSLSQDFQNELDIDLNSPSFKNYGSILLFNRIIGSLVPKSNTSYFVIIPSK